MELWGVTITSGEMILLLLAVGLSLSFEFVNGFHDTANAVATVIYTKSLPATYAVVWSGIMNLTGALFSTGAVAYTILALLPPDLVANSGSGSGFAMVFAILLSAIIWNVGTWYLGLPASSSHTMIGAILGVGIGYAVWNGHPWTDGLDMGQVSKVGLALLVSPLVGFGVAAVLLLILKAVVPFKELFESPKGDTPPPTWIRAILILTCTGVSVSHGSNDAQKGMGLMMLILIGVVPGCFALNMAMDSDQVKALTSQSQAAIVYLQSKAGSTTVDKAGASTELKAYKKGADPTATTFAALLFDVQAVQADIGTNETFDKIAPADRVAIRKDMSALYGGLTNILASKAIASNDTTPTTWEWLCQFVWGKPATGDKKILQDLSDSIHGTIQYIPPYVKFMVALALGLGTMIGWKRIVVTVGEKIGKSHLTYAQGAAAEFTCMCTVAAADYGHAPVSTTHVLSSGIAGTMAANNSGLQTQTLINILLAWVLTLPVCIFLGATIFASALYVVFHVIGG